MRRKNAQKREESGAKRSPPTSSSSTETDYVQNGTSPYPVTVPDFNVEKMEELKYLHQGKNGNVAESCASTGQMSSQISSSRKSSSTASSFTERKNIWSMMTRRRHMLKHGFDEIDGTGDLDEDDDEFLYLNRFDSCKVRTNGCLFEIKNCIETVFKYPHIYISTALVFAALSAVGLIIVEIACKRSIEREIYSAELEAIETAAWFTEIFAKSLIPLRSLQQAVVHSEYFKQLPMQIGNYGQEGSALSIFAPDSNSTGAKDYRDVTGICDNQDMLDKFDEIVAGINDNFDYDGIIVNYRLAPFGVFCAASPLVNSKDFSEAAPFDSRNIIGWDPMHSQDERWKTVLREIYSDQNTMDIFGPMVKNGYDQEGQDDEMFCAHLSVPFPGYNLTVDDKHISTWGFVMHFIHWSRLKEKSGIDERFESKGYTYRLTRADKVENPETGKMTEHDVVLAESPHFSHQLHHHSGDDYVLKTVMTPNGEWTIRVYYHCDEERRYIFVRIATVFGTFVISIMFCLILLERQLHSLLLYKIMPKDAIQKLNKGHTVVERYKVVTIFFSDIVGFTTLAGEMSPIQVMKMLNELYLQFDKIAEKHGVYKVETIGDAYMVVGGAPNRIPAPEAAQRIALFALELVEFVKTFRTSDGDKILIRAGIASGPVVAGVVGQAMPRYCFFGDTVNLASRMESNSKTMKIQCSDFTSRLLQDSPDFSFNLDQRVENGVRGIDVKGKGITQTWWIKSVAGLHTKGGELRGTVPSSISDSVMQSIALSKQDWNRIGLADSSLVVATDDTKIMVNRVTAILEHRLSIVLATRGQDQMDRATRSELKSYVHEISTMYKDVQFHNFEHAVHVTTSMNKMIDTIVESVGSEKEGDGSICENFWQNSFQHFVMIFACLIHDVEHLGRSNKILAEQKHKLARKFKGPTAERNSIQTAMDVMFRSKYKKIRKALFPTIQAKFEFGRCIYWAILCTDIASPERLQNCKSRFDVAHSVRKSMASDEQIMGQPDRCYEYDPELCPLHPFLTEVVASVRITEKQKNERPEELQINQEGLENCVGVEHLMQVSDVSHLLQSWEVFLKYNYRLYKELMICHKAGLMPDPSINWAIGQIGFLQNYVIPLALRCEVIFGNNITSLNLARNATTVLDRWEIDGELVTEIFANSYANGEAESDTIQKCLMVEPTSDMC